MGDAERGGARRAVPAPVVIDVGPVQVRAWGPSGVLREPAAALWSGVRMYYGSEAARLARTAPGSCEPCLPGAVDEEYLALGDRVVPVVETLRGLLRHVITGVTAGEATGPAAGSGTPAALTLVLPGQWGAIRRGVVERSAGGLAERVSAVGSTRAAVAAAQAEGLILAGHSVGVLEQWPAGLLASVVDARGAGKVSEPAYRHEDPPAVYLPGVAVRGASGPEAGDSAAVREALARLGGGRQPDSVLAVPRTGREFTRADTQSQDLRIRHADGDAVVRGGRILTA